MKRFTVIVMDRSHGIDRPLIGEGKFSLGIIGGRIYLEYLFESLRAIEKIVGIPFRIVVPYAHGLDIATPQYAIRDFFYYMTVPCNAGSYKKNGIIDCAAYSQFVKIASRYSIELLQVNKEKAVYGWCLENLNDEDVVIGLHSGQIALNIEATALMIGVFMQSEYTAFCAVGHSVGLTPILYRPDAWIQMLSSWGPEQGSNNPHEVRQVEINPVLKVLEEHKARIFFKTGHDTRNAILIKENPDICRKPLIDVARCCAALMGQKEFKASSGRTFTILFGEGIIYYGDGLSRSPVKFEQTINLFNIETNCLRHFSGIDFINRDVLEVGCGDGVRSILMKRAGARTVVATDLEIGIGSAEQRRLLAQLPKDDKYPINYSLEGEVPTFKTPGLEFIETSGELLPFPDNSFDIVYSNQVLEHVRDPFICMKEMVRVLRVGGVIMLRYNAYFHLTGGHGECTNDIPWSHVIMTPEEMEEYLAYTEFPNRGIEARKSLKNYFNPGRLTIAQFEKYLELLMPVQILHYDTRIQTHLSERITPELLDIARINYPDVTLRDFLVSQVTVILRKI